LNSMIWLGIVILMLVIEIITLGLTTFWFAGGALVAFVAALLGAPLVVQIILFVVVSVALLVITRPIALKYFNKSRVKTNVESIIGKEGIVTDTIDNLSGTGQVKIDGMDWTARAKDSHRSFEIGETVRVVEIQGVKVIVEETVEENKEEV